VRDDPCGGDPRDPASRPNGSVGARVRRPVLRRSTTWLAAVLFVAAAAVVIWQTRRVSSLWDLSYIVNTATRIAHGDRPYRDFGLLHPPGTFLVQAAILKAFGPHYLSLVGYAAAVSGTSVVLTFAIVRTLLRDSFRHAVAPSFFLCLPLVFLSAHAIVPVPFYDGDAGVLLLAALYVALVVRRRSYPTSLCWVLGALVVLPMLFKQNVGLAFFALVHLAFVATAVQERGAAARGYRLIALASTASLAAAVLAIQLTVGLHAYLHWTVTVAGSRRLGGLTGPFAFGVYRSRFEVFALTATVVGAAVLAFAPQVVARVIGGAVLLSPYVVVAWRYREANALLELWPMLLVLGCLSGIVLLVRAQRCFEALVPLVVLGTSFAAFLSQGDVGSSYGVWSLLVIDAAVVVWAAREVAGARNEVMLAVIAGLSGILIVVPAFHYVRTESRLYYVKVASGPLARSTTPALRGLSLRGPYIGQLDELIAYVRANIPRDDPMIIFPGEDPVYFALNRRPLFPVVTFDSTANPYTDAQLETLTVERGVKWLLVEAFDRMQFAVPPAAFWSRTLAALEAARPPCPSEAPSHVPAARCAFRPVATAGSYTVFRLAPETTNGG